MVLDKIFGGVSTFSSEFRHFDLQGQGFDRESAAKIGSIVQRRSSGAWVPLFAAALAVPLSASARQMFLIRYFQNSNKFLSLRQMNGLMAFGNGLSPFVKALLELYCEF